MPVFLLLLYFGPSLVIIILLAVKYMASEMLIVGESVLVVVLGPPGPLPPHQTVSDTTEELGTHSRLGPDP